MTTKLRLAAIGAALMASALMQSASAAEFSSTQKDEIGTIVREYLIAHPKVLQEAMAELDKRQQAADGLPDRDRVWRFGLFVVVGFAEEPDEFV